MKRYSESCILGTGPAARICSLYLKNTSHLVVGNGPVMGSLGKYKMRDRELNYIPIFPVYQSPLYNDLWPEDNEKHDFLEYIDCGDITKEYDKIQHLVSEATPNSYSAKYLSRGESINTQKNILLAYKLLGDVIFEKRLRRLSDKVSRHYGNNLPNARIGFVNGFSAYYDKLRTIPGEDLLEDIIEIDVENKKVVTTQSEIHYQRLISTLNLRDIMRKVKRAPDIQLISRPASFYVFKIEPNLIPHKVIYDLELESPLYRVFSVESDVIIVQLSFLYSMADEDPQPIIDRLKQIFGPQFTVDYQFKYKIKDAYPIDCSSDTDLNQFKTDLEANDIMLIGRFAEWEYLDLHELNYYRVNENHIYKQNA